MCKKGYKQTEEHKRNKIMGMTHSLEEVWNHINIKFKDDCWEWNRHVGTHGYGEIRINKKLYLSHRLVYELTYGSIPKGLFVLHHCDNRKCCNPVHLFLGTHSDNMKDMVKKGRYSKHCRSGEFNGNSKLTKLQVEEIRKLYQTKKYSQRQLGKIFNVDHSVIGDIVLYKLWKDKI